MYSQARTLLLLVPRNEGAVLTNAIHNLGKTKATMDLASLDAFLRAKAHETQ